MLPPPALPALAEAASDAATLNIYCAASPLYFATPHDTLCHC